MSLWKSRSAESTRNASQKLFSVPAPQNGEKLPIPSPHYDAAALSEAQAWNVDDLLPFKRHSDVRNWLATFSLMSQEDYLIDPEIRAVRMGLGWDKGADIDASAALFDEHLRAVDSVWYKQLQSRCGSIVHSGDNLTGEGDGDDETITVKLSDIPLHVHHILFTVCVFSYAVSFKQIRSAYVRMMPEKKGHKRHPMCQFSLTQMSGHAMLMGMLTRKGAYWNFRALGSPATGRNVKEMLANPHNLECLSYCPSFNPEMRFVTVSILKGTGLAAKDRTGFFRRTASSDPYYITKFRNKTYTSEYRPQTLEPEWRHMPFAIGWITEVENKALKIQLFDYDAVGRDDFMGEVRIPPYALFNLAPGNHAFWFTLGDSKKKEYRNEEVSGKILVNFDIQNTDS